MRRASAPLAGRRAPCRLLSFEAWREQRGEPLPSSRFVDFSGLSDLLQSELLVGISVAIAGYRRTRVSELRRVVALIAQRRVSSIAELDVTGVRSQGMRLFVVWAQDHLCLAFADPDSEWRKDVWDMRVFGKPQAYTVNFTAISQPWLRELAKQFSRERAPLVHAGSTRRVVVSIAELSRSLRRREDRGDHPRALARSDISLFLARIGRARAAARISTHRRGVLVGDVAYFLRGARDLGLGADGQPMFGLAGEFSLTREDVRRTARRPATGPRAGFARRGRRAAAGSARAEPARRDAWANDAPRDRATRRHWPATERDLHPDRRTAWTTTTSSTTAARNASWGCSCTTCRRSPGRDAGCRSTRRPSS